MSCHVMKLNLPLLQVAYYKQVSIPPFGSKKFER